MCNIQSTQEDHMLLCKYWNILYSGRMLQSNIIQLFQCMSVSRMLWYTFICVLLYLYQFQCSILHTIVLDWATQRYNKVHGCGHVEQINVHTWSFSLRSSSTSVMSTHDVTSYNQTSLQIGLAQYYMYSVTRSR